MNEIFSRSAMLLGDDAISLLKNKHIAVFGIGGVGGYVVEALARSGVGSLSLIDRDKVSKSNINRQIIALNSTIGRPKAEVAKERVLDINPEINVTVHNMFFLPENAHKFDFSNYDYIVDAIDTVTSKLELIKKAYDANTPIISCMGAGNKLDPTKFEVSDIYKTSVCPLARVMRRELKKIGIEKLKVIYSKEEPIISGCAQGSQKPTPGSVAFVPSVAGLILAGEVIKDIIKECT